MVLPPPDTLLARMAGIAPAASAGPSDRGAAPGLARALGEAMARVGARLPALDLTVVERTCERVETADAIGALPDLALTLPLRGPDGEVAGALVLDGTLVDALVEVQTIGRVDAAGRAARAPTRIDAALARPFATALVTETVSRSSGDPDAVAVAPLDPVRHLVGGAQLRREVEAPIAIVATVRATLAGAARETVMRLILPARPAAGLPIPSAAAAPRPKARPEDVLAAGTVRLEAVLPPLRIPLAQLTALKVGDAIPLPLDALARLTLRGGRLGTGRPLPRARGPAIEGRLGQQGGLRAVKLSDPTAPASEGAAAPTPRPSLATARPAPVVPAPDLDAADLPPLGDLPDLADLPAL